ncbi:unnamed protein product [Medioppia subpectinata]|uniref:ABC-type glutathione-S-conjugate transporter n=1 Tax=Medioppia subpectinata TaxID=1979941 RepID=A0A7R9KE18_9ACAR|nr:unnamed protein product [Medioppia subpectinata]CAG2101456.1 unnamed protein product [Medioppia subpectinata]
MWLVANEQAVQRALTDALIGDRKDRLSAADQRLAKNKSKTFVRVLFPTTQLSLTIITPSVDTVITGDHNIDRLSPISPPHRPLHQPSSIITISVDIQRILDFVLLANLVWSAPFQIAIALVLLWRQLGAASLAGLVFLVILMPFNAYMANKVRKYQVIQMEAKDQRVKLMSEILNAIKVLKLYAWEKPFGDRVVSARDKEVNALNKVAVYEGAMIFTFVGLFSFMAFVLMSSDNILDPNKAFVSLTLISLRVALGAINILTLACLGFVSLAPKLKIMIFSNTKVTPNIPGKGQYINCAQRDLRCWVSLNRIDRFMNANEINENTISMDKNNANKSIIVRNATFSWNIGPGSAVLNNISLEVSDKRLVAVVGSVGAGKSSLLAALLGELAILEGSAGVNGTVAYVPQEPWIQNKTLKENIVFTNELNDEYYERVLESCDLVPDLSVLPDRDMTEIGEKGINLSGGQKQRVSLARAVYSNRDIYLLDDPLSAVDPHVGKHLFDKTIGRNGLLKDKIRILVTNCVTILPNVDQIVVIKNGYVSESGTYEELISKNGYFAQFVAEYLSEQPDNELENEDKFSDESVKCLKEQTFDKNIIQQKLTIKTSAQMTGAERSETSSVGLGVYKKFISLIGGRFCAAIIVSAVAATTAQILSGIWLSEWSDDSLDSINIVNDTNGRYVRLGVYAGIGVFDTIFNLIANIGISLGCIRAAKHLHNIMLNRVLKTPMQFYNTTPMGRILNWFSGDMDSTDVSLVFSVRMTITLFLRAFVALFMISLETPIVLTAIIVTAFIYYYIQKLYIPSSRQLKRIESTTRSPIYIHFGETVSGSASIRAYGVSHQFIQESNRRVDENHMCYYPCFTAARWLAIRLEFLGYCIVFVTAVLAVLYKHKLTPGVAGLAISYALNITSVLASFVKTVSTLETNIVSVERCLEYTHSPTEPEWYNKATKPLPHSWPERGEIKFSEYSARYREGLDLVLNAITFAVKPAEKVAIVGRTGAGKSSLTLGLFRLIEPVNGAILIDDVDISALGLHELRSRLTIIPQEPTLFTGTLRHNLDPFNHWSDNDIWRALELAHLRPFVDTLEKGLSHEISKGGDNLSVGQKQLICLARALLRKTKVLVLDEATAAVDMETDDLIQETIRNEFCLSTVVTIAHRLNTIIDYDKVLVIDKGMVAEFDSPHHLLQNTNSIFYSMAKEANLV